MFVVSLARAPLVVDGGIRQLRRIEAMADVKSVNLMVPDMWTRLWANSFLLRKEQFFETHTYEARRNTALRGDWDLEGGIVSLRLPGAARREITPRFALVDTRSPLHLRVRLGAGWHAPEFLPHTPERWQWTAGDAEIRIRNPHGSVRRVALVLDARGLDESEVTFGFKGGPGASSVKMGTQRKKARFAPIEIPPGDSLLVLRSNRPPARAAADDPRLFGICVFGLGLEASE